MRVSCFGGASDVAKTPLLTKEKSPKATKAKKPRRILSGLMVLAMTAITLTTAFSPERVTAQADVKRRSRTVMYVSDSADLPLTDASARDIDQINYAFALLSDGEATGDHWQGIRKMKSFLTRHPEIDGVLSVGGWGADGFSQACRTQEGREVLAGSILRLMDEHGFVGVDIDWEYPGFSHAGIESHPEDTENWYDLLSLLREGLDERERQNGRPYLLSVALGAGKSLLESIDAARLNELVDQAVVMAYDLCGFEKITGHHAGLYPDSDKADTGAHAVKMLTEGGMSPGKILLGIPTYGRMWRQVAFAGNGLGSRAETTGNKVVPYGEMQALEGSGYTRYYDEDAQSPWWFDGGRFVSGEDATSLQYKARWVSENNLGGVALWAANHDPDGEAVKVLTTHLE